MKIGETYIAEHLSSFELLSASTNNVYRVPYEGQTYILKISNMTDETLSPFWHQMKAVFGVNVESSIDNMRDLLTILAFNPHVAAARLVEASHEGRYLLFKEVKGVSYSPDRFPLDEALLEQLGRYVGYFHHKRRFARYGVYPAMKRGREGFRESVLAVMREMLGLYWPGNEEVRQAFDTLAKTDFEPDTFCLIMPDISANQFIYGEGLHTLKAVVDFDAYVVGPPEWELAVLETCLPDGEAFRRGYETYGPMPALGRARDFYRFASYLCDPGAKEELAHFLSRDHHFA